MSRAAKLGLGTLGGLALMAGIAWIYQDAMLLEHDAPDDEYIYWPN